MRSKPTNRKSRLVPISDVLAASQKKTQGAFAISQLRKDWLMIVGDLLVNQTHPKKIERNMLWISVENSALHYELSLMKPLLIDKIAQISNKRFKDLKFVHEEVQANAPSQDTKIRKKFERKEADQDEDLQQMLKRIKGLSLDLQKKRGNQSGI